MLVAPSVLSKQIHNDPSVRVHRHINLGGNFFELQATAFPTDDDLGRIGNNVPDVEITSTFELSHLRCDLGQGIDDQLGLWIFGLGKHSNEIVIIVGPGKNGIL